MQTINPANGEVLKSYSLDEGVDWTSLHELQRKWDRKGLEKRLEWLEKHCVELQTHKEALARMCSLEMGKPLAQATAEVEKCILLCQVYLRKTEEWLIPKAEPVTPGHAHLQVRPLGVVLAIMPWNFPYWQVYRCVIPALLVGNGVVLKHAPNVWGCAELLASMFQDLPLRNVKMDIPATEKLIAEPGIRAVSLTGSSRAGSRVAELAGRHLKKCVLELGGNDPFVVLEGANLSRAVDLYFDSRMNNGGQTCIAAKRALVYEGGVEEFLERLLEKMRGVRMGDPMDPETTLGPMAREDLRDQLHAQVKTMEGTGAKLHLGGEVPQGKGAFYPPTVLELSETFDEEVFGPVAMVQGYGSAQEALELANQTRFGLGAAVVGPPDAALLFAHGVEAGCCFVNDFVKSDPLLPFGGIKHSGFGRELGREGLYEFANLKTVRVLPLTP